MDGVWLMYTCQRDGDRCGASAAQSCLQRRNATVPAAAFLASLAPLPLDSSSSGRAPSL